MHTWFTGRGWGAVDVSLVWISRPFAYVTLRVFVQQEHRAAATARASFFIPLGPLTVLADGCSLIGLLLLHASSFAEMLSPHVLMLNAAEGFWLLGLCVGCLRRVTGRLETALDAVPEGRYLAGLYTPRSAPRVPAQSVWMRSSRFCLTDLWQKKSRKTKNSVILTVAARSLCKLCTFKNWKAA